MALGSELVRAPLHLGLSVAERVLDAGLGVVRAARELIEPDVAAPPREPAPGPPPPRVPADSPPPAARATPPPASPPTPPPAATPFPPVEEHVDEEAVLAAEVAEEGAEEGAHAELHVEEPWDGYDRMRVHEITTELEGATREALAAVELYESTHKGRRSVLDSAERRLRELSGPGATAGNGDAPVSGA